MRQGLIYLYRASCRILESRRLLLCYIPVLVTSCFAAACGIGSGEDERDGPTASGVASPFRSSQLLDEDTESKSSVIRGSKTCIFVGERIGEGRATTGKRRKLACR